MREERGNQIRRLEVLIDDYEEKIETFKRVIMECKSDIEELREGEGEGRWKT